tara:strand:+ start:4049 stop:4285 length:237 start_codon:yes stop_codon:yes gene_type:complete
MSRTFVILDASEVEDINFDEVIEGQADQLRYSLDGLKTFVKFDGDTPDFLEGKDTLTHAEILEELSGPYWTTPPDPLP